LLGDAITADAEEKLARTDFASTKGRTKSLGGPTELPEFGVVKLPISLIMAGFGPVNLLLMSAARCCFPRGKTSASTLPRMMMGKANNLAGRTAFPAFLDKSAMSAPFEEMNLMLTTKIAAIALALLQAYEVGGLRWEHL
jgi:hypothetical protein